MENNGGYMKPFSKAGKNAHHIFKGTPHVREPELSQPHATSSGPFKLMPSLAALDLLAL